MKTYSDREVVKRLKNEGWVEIKRGGKGSHRQFKKPGYGFITVPKAKDIDVKTYRSIAREAHWL